MKQFIKLLQWETVVRRNSSLTIQGNSIVRQGWNQTRQTMACWGLPTDHYIFACDEAKCDSDISPQGVSHHKVGLSNSLWTRGELEEHGSQITIKATVPAPFKFRGGDIWTTIPPMMWWTKRSRTHTAVATFLPNEMAVLHLIIITLLQNEWIDPTLKSTHWVTANSRATKATMDQIAIGLETETIHRQHDAILACALVIDL